VLQKNYWFDGHLVGKISILGQAPPPAENRLGQAPSLGRPKFQENFLLHEKFLILGDKRMLGDISRFSRATLKTPLRLGSKASPLPPKNFLNI
jgi:hypothetical protein